MRRVKKRPFPVSVWTALLSFGRTYLWEMLREPSCSDQGNISSERKETEKEYMTVDPTADPSEGWI